MDDQARLGVHAPHVRQQLADDAAQALADPVRRRLGLSGWRDVRIKTDGAGKWMDAGDLRLGNRAQRRKLAREARARQREVGAG